MKKSHIVNLIKYYSEKDDVAFRAQAYEIAREFDRIGDYQVTEYILALLAEPNTFIPQVIYNNLNYLKKVELKSAPLPLPDVIKDDVVGIVNAANSNLGVNKFLFQGAPGTGKTETVKHIARILERELFIVDFASVIDCKLGQTAKNIAQLFIEINSFLIPERSIVLFDEIDALALDRTDSNDLREMGRATTAVLQGLDSLNDEILLIATTNLYQHFDKALVRRFDSIIDFNRYSREELIDIAEILLNHYLSIFKNGARNMRLFRKIISLQDQIPYPGELKNIIKTSLAFSNPNNEFDYLCRLYSSITSNKHMDIKQLREQGFTVREIEILTGVSKSQAARELKEK